jgi:L-fuconolactonase
MTANYEPKHSVDTHQHLWVISERSYDWLVPEYGVIYNDFRPEDVAADVKAAGITGTVLVQAADNYDDTFYMMSVAAKDPAIAGIVGWVPFDRPAEAEAALDSFAKSKVIKGFRNLTHNYDDPRWILRPEVAKTLELLSPRGFTLDMVSVNSDHNQAILELAKRHPDLKIVIDHMAKPPIASEGWQPWADELAALSEQPNVYCKISGLNTASAPGFSFKDWQPYVDHIVNHFGSRRVMLGSDWPVSLLNGDFAGVWQAQRDVIASYSTEAQDDIYFRAAAEFYSLELG